MESNIDNLLISIKNFADYFFILLLFAIALASIFGYAAGYYYLKFKTLSKMFKEMPNGKYILEVKQDDDTINLELFESK